MPGPLAVRRREAEWMDAPDADPHQLRNSLAFIRRVNSLLGYTRATINHLDRFSRSWSRGETTTILDVATGSGDVPRAILRWADRRGCDVRVTGIDLHAQTLQNAAENDDPRLRFIRANATRLPFADGSFDYVLTSMFLHHLDEPLVVTVLKEMDRVASQGVIIADLVRGYRAYAWISLFTLLANPMVRHDARVSVAQAFSRNEIMAMRNQADLKYTRYFKHFGHRFVLAGEKTV